MPHEAGHFDWMDDFYNYGGGNNPFDQPGFTFNPQGIANQAAQSYDPSSGQTFESYLNQQFPSVLGQMGQALGQDFEQMNLANQFSQQMQQEGLETLMGSLDDFRTDFGGFMEQLQGSMSDIEDSDRQALQDFSSGMEAAIADLLSGAGSMREAGQRTGDELREYGQSMLEGAEGISDEFISRAEEQERQLGVFMAEAREKFGEKADVMMRAAKDSLRTVKGAAASFIDNSMAMAQAQVAGINRSRQVEKDMIAMNPDMSEAQKASLSQTLDRQGAEQLQQIAAVTAFGINQNKYQNEMAIAGAEAAVAGVAGQVAQMTIGLEANLGQVMTNVFSITNQMVAQGISLEEGLKSEAYQMMGQGALQQFTADMQAAGFEAKAAELQAAQQSQELSFQQYMSASHSENQQFLASFFMQGQAALMQGDAMTAEYMANMTVNPVSMGSLLASLWQFQMMGMEAGIDFSSETGLDFGRMMEGLNPEQFYSLTMNNPNFSGEIPSSFEMGIPDQAMQNLQNLMSGLGSLSTFT